MGPKALVPKLERAYWELQNPQMASGGPKAPPEVVQKYGGMGYKYRGQKCSVNLKIITRLRNRPISSETHRMVLRSEAANRLHSWCGCSQNSMESWPSLWGTDWPCFCAWQPEGALRKLVIILRILPWSHQPVQSSTRKCVKNSFKMPHYIILHIRAM